MALEPFDFSHTWQDRSFFPTVMASEDDVRSKLQAIPDELLEFINAIVDYLTNSRAAEEVGLTPLTEFPDADNVQALFEAINDKLTSAASTDYIGGPLTFSWEDKNEDTHTVSFQSEVDLKEFLSGLAKHLTDFAIDTLGETGIEEAVQQAQAAAVTAAEEAADASTAANNAASAASTATAKAEEAIEAAEEAALVTLGKADKANVVAAPLAAGSWAGTSAPYTYTLQVTGVKSNTVQQITFAQNPAKEVIKALQDANIVDGGIGTGVITLKAYGKKPTINCPIRVVMYGEAATGSNGANIVTFGGGSGGGFYPAASAPTDTSLLWIDTTNNVIKYHNGITWKALGGVWG